MTTFADRIAEFEHWLEPLDDGDEISEIANRFDRYADEFWTDLVTMFEAAHSDDTSPLKPGHGADQLMLMRQYDGDGGVSCCTVMFYVGGLKLSTRAFERRELCTEHEDGVEAAAEALATLAAAIDTALEPFAGLDTPAKGDREVDILLGKMRYAISAYCGAVWEPAAQKEYAALAVDMAEKLDKAVTGGLAHPTPWIDTNAEAIRVSVLANARAEAERAHRFHDEASAEVDKLTAEKRELKREIAALRAELDKIREGWTVIGVWDNDRAIPAGVVRGRLTNVTDDNPDGHWSRGVWATPVDADTAEEAERLAVAAMEFEECFTTGCEESAAESMDDDRCGDCANLLSTLENRGGEDIDWHDKRTRAELEAAVAALNVPLVWESAGTDEPGDQNAGSRRIVPDCNGARYSIGPASGGTWSLELIQTFDAEERSSLSFGRFPSESDAKGAAQRYENGEDV